MHGGSITDRGGPAYAPNHRVPGFGTTPPRVENRERAFFQWVQLQCDKAARTTWIPMKLRRYITKSEEDGSGLSDAVRAMRSIWTRMRTVLIACLVSALLITVTMKWYAVSSIKPDDVIVAAISDAIPVLSPRETVSFIQRMDLSHRECVRFQGDDLKNGADPTKNVFTYAGSETQIISRAQLEMLLLKKCNENSCECLSAFEIGIAADVMVVNTSERMLIAYEPRMAGAISGDHLATIDGFTQYYDDASELEFSGNGGLMGLARLRGGESLCVTFSVSQYHTLCDRVR